MKNHLRAFQQFLKEAADPTYYQETFYFTILIAMSKDIGGSRDETKNDIRAFPEILTVTLVEPEKGGIQRDIGTKYLSTLKIHVRKPKDVNKTALMKKIVLLINNLRGITVLRYKEKQPKQRRKAFHGSYSITEDNYQQRPSRKSNLRKAFNTYTKSGPQKKGGYPHTPEDPDWKSAPPGAAGGLEETQLVEAMKTAADLPEDVVVVVLKESDGSGFQVYYAPRDKPNVRLKAGDLDRMEAGIDIFGTLYVGRGRNEPYEGVYIITSAKAKDGYGPLLYDIALEVAGEDGLKPDVEDVSDEASAVWKYYDTLRDDVRSAMLVDIRDEDAYSLVMPYDRAEQAAANRHLAKVYFKKDKSVTQDLIGQDKFIELKPGTQIPTPSAREEFTDLAGELNVPIVKNQDLSRFDRLYEDVIIAIGQNPDDLMAFDVKPHLQPKIWDDNDHIRRGIKGALMDIVDEFLENLDLDVEVKDVILTGSMANYNWSKFSDIDLHILIDFTEVNDNEILVKKFFDAIRSRWNKLHNIHVKGHEVEIYVQDEHEPHTSTGVYSLYKDEWVVKPQKIEPQIDEATAIKKMTSIQKELDKLRSLYNNERYEDSFAMASRIKDKISRMRKTGLDRSGIYSPENIAFKMMRRSGDIESLFTIYTKSYDKVFSLDQ